MWLFRFPLVTRHGPHAPRIAPVISLTVVLPLLPVMPTTVPAKSRRHALAKRGQRTQRVRHDDLRHRGGDRPRNDGARGAAGRRLGNEVVAVEVLAGERDEQRARLERAAVGSDRAECGILALQRCRRRRGRIRRGRGSCFHSQRVEHDATVAERPDVATDDLVVLVALARDHHRVARIGLREREMNRLGAIGHDVRSLGLAHAGRGSAR